MKILKVIKVIVGLFMVLGSIGSILGIFYLEEAVTKFIIIGIFKAFIGYALLSSAFRKEITNKTNFKLKLKAFFIAPIFVFAPVVIFLLSGEFSFITRGESAGLSVLIGIPIIYISVLIVGLPGYIFLEEKNKLSYLSLLLIGSISGFFCAFGWISGGMFDFAEVKTNMYFLLALFSFSFCSGVSAVFYGKIVKGI